VFSIVVLNASVDHECSLGMSVHIMGGAAIAGKVILGKGQWLIFP